MLSPQPTTTGRAGDRRRLAALLTVCLGYFMVILDTTVVNIALPDLRRGLGADVAGLAWVVDGYTLALAALLLPAGGLGDRVGARRTFLAGLAGLTAASAACAAAASLPLLVAARVAQGLGAALLIPSSLALVHATFGDRAGRARAIGTWGAVGGVAAAAGPVAGGLLVGWAGWRSVFLVNLPVGAATAALTGRLVPAGGHQGGRGRGMDLGGQAAGVACLALLTFAVIEGGRPGGAVPGAVAAVTAGAAGAGFVAAERRAADPVLPLELFRRPAFAAGTAVGLLLNLGFYGQLFVVGLWLQQVRGDRPATAGLLLLAETGMATVSSAASGRLAARVGPRRPLLVGLAAGAAGLAGLATVGPGAGDALLAGLLALVGFGMAFAMPAATTAVVDAAPAERVGVAAAVLTTARQVGSVLGVAVLGGLLGAGQGFLPGMVRGLLLASGAFLLGGLLTAHAVRPGRSPQEPAG